MSRVKVGFNHQLYSLGQKPASFEALLTAIHSTIPQLAHTPSLIVRFQDPDFELVHITTTNALIEAYRLFPKCLRLVVETGEPLSCLRPRQDVDELLPVAKAREMLRALCILTRGREVLGAGGLLDNTVLLTASSVLPNREVAAAVTAYFRGQGKKCVSILRNCGSLTLIWY